MELQLQRPLVFFDLEATGPDRANDRITQYCFHVFDPDGCNMVWEAKVNPQRLIPVHVAELTGIRNEDVAHLADFSHHASTVLQIIEDADLVGFGCLLFDVPLLFAELARFGFIWDYTRCNIVDACTIYKRQTPRDLTSALHYYANKQLDGAHNAMADVNATREVFLLQLEKHELSKDLSQLALYSNYDKPLVDLSGKFSIDADGDVTFNFSKSKGEKVKNNISLLYWMLDKDFTEDVKIICRNLIETFTPKPAESLTDDGLPF